MNPSQAGARRNPVTIADVAEKAGVSLSTVSRVMNNNQTVDPELGERVRIAATELGYTANPLARSLVLGKTMTVAVMVPDLGNPTFQGILHGLSEAASEDNYQVLVADSQERAETEHQVAYQARRRCDGIILCAPRMSEGDLSQLLDQVAPVVVINRLPKSADFPSIVVDYRIGFLRLLEHLYGLGHRELVFLEGIHEAAANTNRLDAIHSFSESHDDVHIQRIPCGVGFADGHAAAQLVVGATAVLAYNDLVAMGLLSALAEKGLRVPDDISVVGFDDIQFARYTAPALTTAAVSVEDLGRQAWLRMHALLQQHEPPSDLVFTPRLVIRASSGPHPAASV